MKRIAICFFSVLNCFTGVFAQTVEQPLPPGSDSDWYTKVCEAIRKSEYNIAYSEAHCGLRSHNRNNHFYIDISGSGFTLTPKTEAASPIRFLVEGVYASNTKRLPADVIGYEHREANNVIFWHRGFKEQYINTPDGLRQNFIINQDLQSKQIRIAINVLGATVSAQDKSTMKIHGDGGITLLYSDLVVWDAKGTKLKSEMRKNGDNQIELLVYDVDKAHYPITVDPLSTTANWQVIGSQGSANFAHSVASAGDVNGDGYSDVLVGAFNFDNGSSNEGAVYGYYGSANGLSTTADWQIEGNADGRQMGYAVASAGDVNGDGYSDVVVGVPGYTNVESVEGAAFVYYGSSGGLSTTVSWSAESNQSLSRFGLSVASAGDVNGDGYSDVIVGAYEYDDVENNEGAAFIYYGSATGLSGTANWHGEINSGGANFGNVVACAGDVNGDGYSDVVVGAFGYTGSLSGQGAAYVFHGGLSGVSTTANWQFFGSQASEKFAFSAASAGDVNGDGYSDIIIGSPYYDHSALNSPGTAYVFYGSSTGVSASVSWQTQGAIAMDSYGYAVASAGDVNGDGFGDVVVGVPGFDADQSNEGAAFLYYGSASGLNTSTDAQTEGNQDACNYGTAVASAGDVNGDGYSDLLVGAYAYDAGTLNRGSAFVYHGGAAGLIQAVGVQLEVDKQSAQFALSVSSAGDVNGDGYGDVIVGAPNYTNGQTNEGAAFVFHGGANGLSTTAAWQDESNLAAAFFGYSAAAAGDVNGDGYGDVIVGAYGYTNGQSQEGAAFVYHGGPSGLSTTASWNVERNWASSRFGISVASAGDVNGDGYSDVIIGAFYYSNGQSLEGAAYVYHGSSAGLHTTAAWQVESDLAEARFGRSVATAGDVNGDGYSDVIVGAIYYANGQSYEGAAYVYHGSNNGLSATHDWQVESNQASSDFGFCVSSAGDVNGDGYSDVIAGAYYQDGDLTDEGLAYVYHGSATGLSNSPDWTAEGNQAFAYFGVSVAGAGDVNGDGYSDVIVGAFKYDNGQNDEGASFVFHGSATGLSASANWQAEGNQATAYFGRAVAGAGDVNGDGYSDVLVGASLFDNGLSDEGAAFVYYGNGGGGLRNNAQALAANLTSIYAASSLCDQGLGMALFNKSPLGRVKGAIQVETVQQGDAWGSGSRTTGSLADLGLSGNNQKLAVNYEAATITRVRVRQVFDKATAIDGRFYGPWRYLQEAQAPAALGGFYGGDIILWDGTDWCKGSGTANAPAADASKRLLVQGNGAVIAQNAVVDQFQINWPHDALIQPGIGLTVSTAAKNYNPTAASFTIAANTTTSAVASYVGPAIDQTEMQYGIKAAGWHYISIPFAITAAAWQAQNATGTIAITGSATTQNLQRYNTTLGAGTNTGYSTGGFSSFSAGKWQLPDANEVLNASGYNFYINQYFGGAPQIINAQGLTQDAQVSYTLYSANGGWNMIPNPYPATLNLADMYTQNSTEMDPGIYIWDAATSNLVSIDASSGLTTHSDLGVNANGSFAAAGQAMYVRPTDYSNVVEAANSTVTTATKTLTITPAMRTTTAANLYKQRPFVGIKAANTVSQKADQVALIFDEQYADGFTKGEDIAKLFSDSEGAAHLFLVDGSAAMAIGKYKTPVGQTEIPLAFSHEQAGAAYIALTDIPDYWSVFLKDFKTGAVKDLTKGNYSFVHDPLDNPQRFALVLSSEELNLIETAGHNEDPIVWVKSGALHIYLNQDADEPVRIALVNMAGQVVVRHNSAQAAPILEVPVQVAPGLYTVQIERVLHGHVFHAKIVVP